DEDAHLRARDDHPHMKPSVRIRHGIDGPLVPPRLLRSQLLPRVGGLSDVLYGVAPSGRVFRWEIEWPEVDRIVRRSIDAVERDTHETLLWDILASDVKLDRAVGELYPLQVGDALAGVFAETNALPGSVAKARDAAVEDLQAPGLDCSLLAGSVGGSNAQSNGTGERGDDENLSAHGCSLPGVH